MPTRFERARPKIIAVFDALEIPVLKPAQIRKIYKDQREHWNLPESLTFTDFVDLLQADGQLKTVVVDLPYRPETLYVWGTVSPFVMASALKKDGYLTHYTAMQIHELSNQSPEVIYLNQEQRPQPVPTGQLTQEAVDRVFRGNQRTSSNVATMGRQTICVINGKNTGSLGVIKVEDAAGWPVRVTSLERTLIDIVVRPVYAGGVSEVLEAYRRAADRVQVNKLLAMLRKLDYKYPYAQAVGFYMERCGAYPEKRLAMLEAELSEIDFYLTYGMREPDYSSRWKIYFPKGL